MSLEEMVRRSDEIAVARCVGKESYFGGANGKKILTDFHFEVSDSAKGPRRVQMTLTLLGGRIDPFETRVAGGPEFEVGQEAVLFTRSGGKRRVLTGYTQGVFPVAADAATGRRYVLPRGFSGVQFLEAPGGPGEDRSLLRKPIELDEFLHRVRELDRVQGRSDRNRAAETPRVVAEE
jgi:hypothetical protein